MKYNHVGIPTAGSFDGEIPPREQPAASAMATAVTSSVLPPSVWSP